MLICEGPDRVGKTTVAKHLRRLLPGWSYRHHTKPPIDAYAYFGLFLADSHSRLIVDRLHWSDQAYGVAYRDGQCLTPQQWRLVELMCLNHQAHVLLLTDNTDRILERYGSDEMWPVEGVRTTNKAYLNLYNCVPQPHVSHLKSRVCSLPDLVADDKPTDLLLKLVAKERDRMRRLDHVFYLPPSQALGSWNSPFWILGDEPSDVQLDKPILGPCCPWDRGPAADWLWQALDLAHVRWWDGLYTNASAFQGPTALGMAIFQRQPQAIVALGKRAQDLVNATMVDYRSTSMGKLADHVAVHRLNHPSHARRFDSRNLAGYAEQLRQALMPWTEEAQCTSAVATTQPTSPTATLSASVTTTAAMLAPGTSSAGS